MENEKSLAYILRCTRCQARIETSTKPGPKVNCFLCLSCEMKWQEIRDKMTDHAYQDEVRDAFISFVNGLAHLRNKTLL